MELPQHWAQVEGFSPNLGSSGGPLVVWGWSDESVEEAEQVAGQRLAEALERIAREGGLPAGHGYYPRTPLREPVLEELLDAHGQRIAAITRNRMGCEVVCTDTLFIADVDVPGLEDPSEEGSGVLRSLLRAAGPVGGGSGDAGGARAVSGLRGRLKRLLSGDPAPVPMAPTPVGTTTAGPTPVDSMPVDTTPGAGVPSAAEWRACEPVWEFAQRHADLGVRVYRTAAGLRVLVTGAAAPPMSQRARELLTELGSDPLYVELCATHDSYRARLTPKPFRVGWHVPSASWPFSDQRARSDHEHWLADYRRASEGYAVCRLVSASGPVPGVDEQRLVELHDARCGVGESSPLA